MRLATLIISGVLSLVLGVQSCAVAAGGTISLSISTTEAEKERASELSNGGAVGVLAAFLWLAAAGFVMAKPKVSMWLFAVAGLLCLIGGATGFSDLFVWAVVSLVFAAMSWRGIQEKDEAEVKERDRFQADVSAAATAMGLAPQDAGASPPAGAAVPPLPPAGWHPDPSGGSQLRYWDGHRWTGETRPISTPSPGAADC